MKHLIPFSIILLFLSACDLNTNLDLSKVKDPESDIYKIYEGIEIESIYKEDLNYDGNMDISISGYAYNGDWLEAYFIHNGDLANTYTHFTSDAYWDSYEDYEENYSSIEAYYAEMELNSKVEDITYEDITGDGIDDAIVITNYSLDDYQSIDLTFFIGKDDGYSYYSLAEMHHPEVYDDFSAFKAVVTKDEYFTVELGGDDPYWDRFITFRYDDELGDVLLHKDGGTIIGDDGQLVREEVLGSDDFGMVYLEAFTPNGAEFFSLKREVTVSNTAEFLNALGDNKVIYVEEGTYYLDELSMLPEEAQKAYQNADSWSEFFRSQYYAYYCGNKDYGDALELTINNLNNVSIIGNGNVEFVVRDEMVTVLSFINCENVNMTNVYMVHDVGGICGADVVDIDNSYDMSFKSCVFDGSGELGVYAYMSFNVSFEDCDFTNCTSGGIEFGESEGEFNSCTFSNNEIWLALVYAYGYSNLSFYDCSFYNNEETSSDYVTERTYLFKVEGESYVYLDEDCEIKDNKVAEILNDIEFVEIE